MLISNEWLKEYVTIDDSVSDLAERITRTGIEVDDLIDYTKDIKNLVVGFVKSNAVIMEKGTTDPYQDKVLRASQGSVFHLPVMTQDLDTFITQFNGPVYGTALENAVAYKEVTSSDSFALLLGNEGEGVNPELLAHTTQNLIIPIYGKAESLNVAIAGSILLYHLKG